MKHLLSAAVLLLSLLSLGACQSKRALDTRMEEIAGDYRLQSISDPRRSYLPEMPAAEREAVSAARITRAGKDGTWVFEYTYPIPLSAQGGFQYHRMVQELTWDQSFGWYFFTRLTEEDLRSTGFAPEDITVEMRGHGTVVIRNNLTHITCEWTRLNGNAL